MLVCANKRLDIQEGNLEIFLDGVKGGFLIFTGTCGHHGFGIFVKLPVTQIGFLDAAPDRSCIGKFKLKCLQIAPFQVCPPKKIHVRGGTPPSHTHPPLVASLLGHVLRTCFFTYIRFYLHPWPDQSKTPCYAPAKRPLLKNIPCVDVI